MGFSNPDAVVFDTLAFESRILESDYGRVVHIIVCACNCASDIFEILSHHTIARAWVCRKKQSHLLHCITSCVPRRGTKKFILLRLISRKVFGTEKFKQLIQVYFDVILIQNVPTLRKHVSWITLCHILRKE